METLTDENTLVIKLFDIHGDPYYIDSSMGQDQLRQALPITLAFNTIDTHIATEHIQSNWHWSGSRVRKVWTAPDAVHHAVHLQSLIGDCYHVQIYLQLPISGAGWQEMPLLRLIR